MVIRPNASHRCVGPTLRDQSSLSNELDWNEMIPLCKHYAGRAQGLRSPVFSARRASHVDRLVQPPPLLVLMRLVHFGEARILPSMRIVQWERSLHTIDASDRARVAREGPSFRAADRPTR